MLTNHALDRRPQGAVLSGDVCYEGVRRAGDIVFPVIVPIHRVEMGMRVFGGDGAQGLTKVIRGETAIAEGGSEPVGNRRFARHRSTTDKNDTRVTHADLEAERAEDANTGASPQVRDTQRPAVERPAPTTVRARHAGRAPVRSNRLIMYEAPLSIPEGML